MAKTMKKTTKFFRRLCLLMELSWLKVFAFVLVVVNQANHTVMPM